ncbi:HlyD family type I secretion periplasmic adaptor subunit [Thioalkalivibrio versutus]|nr:HlyD family type I secretion periplasmic adaptor subunit [Thioalkalivibrio versutus]
MKKRGTESVRREFLPAAMELEATPAHPLGRAIIWFIVALFVVAVVWASIGKVDVIAIADGSIVPSGKLRTVQPPALGVVAEIRVQSGDHVEAGDPLFILNATLTTADVDRLRESIRKRQQHAERLEHFTRSLMPDAELASLAHPLPLQHVSVESSAQDLLLTMQLEAFRTMDLALEQQIRAREGQLAHASAHVQRMEQILPLMQERTDAIDTLQRQGMAARMQWLELEQGIVDTRGQIKAERHRLDQIRSEISELIHRREQLHVETRRDALAELEQLRSELEELGQDLTKARELNRQQILYAPVSGVVHEQRVNTLGAVVQPAEPLLEIVPDGEELIVEAWILNRDIGFVREGQKASVKVHTFQFTKYGTVPGEVIRVSRDAVIDEIAGPRYLARIRMERDWMDIAGERTNLAPGMAASAEVAIGQRRLIEFFAAPLLSALDEAGRER